MGGVHPFCPTLWIRHCFCLVSAEKYNTACNILVHSLQQYISSKTEFSATTRRDNSDSLRTCQNPPHLSYNNWSGLLALIFSWHNPPSQTRSCMVKLNCLCCQPPKLYTAPLIRFYTVWSTTAWRRVACMHVHVIGPKPARQNKANKIWSQIIKRKFPKVLKLDVFFSFPALIVTKY